MLSHQLAAGGGGGVRWPEGVVRLRGFGPQAPVPALSVLQDEPVSLPLVRGHSTHSVKLLPPEI